MAAAGAVASRYLRSAVQPRLIVAGADFVVALDPLPVIARVTSIAEDHQGRIPPALQVELARYAAHRDGPVVAPWPAGAGPFDIGEFVVTLWERAPNRPVSPESVGRALRRFHECIDFFIELIVLTGQGLLGASSFVLTDLTSRLISDRLGGRRV